MDQGSALPRMKYTTIIAAALLLSTTVHAGNPVVAIETSAGEILVEVFSDKAPKTAENFLDYVKDNYYAGTIFNRVVAGHFVQAGGRLADLSKKPRRLPVVSEADNGLKNVRGTVSASRFPEDPDSATSEFFINVGNNPHLDRTDQQEAGYTVFGRVVSGMGVVDRISNTKTVQKGSHKELPETPITIRTVRLR